MKSFKQKKKRFKARKRDREKGIWRYMNMNHVCPNSTKPFNRKYYIFDDVSKTYIAEFVSIKLPFTSTMKFNDGSTLEVTSVQHHAKVYDKNFLADRTIAMMKGLGGAWRAIRVK